MPPKKIPNILLIGVGRWGMNHLRVWVRLEAEGLCRLVGVQDSDPQRLKEVADEFGVETFSDDSGIKRADAVDVVVPTYNHFPVIKKALAAGKDVLVEKPMVETMAEAREAEKLQKKSDNILMVGHLFRYNPAADYVKKLIADKELGKIRFMRARFMGFRFPEVDAGILATTAIHFIYMSNQFLGKFPKKVWAQTDHMFGTKLDDHCFIRLDYGQEFAMIESDYFTPGKHRSFEIVGTQGSVVVDLLNQHLDIHRNRHVPVGKRMETYEGGVVRHKMEFQEPLDLELRHYLKCIQDRSEPVTGLADGLETLKIIEAAYESSRTGKTVPLN